MHRPIEPQVVDAYNSPAPPKVHRATSGVRFLAPAGPTSHWECVFGKNWRLYEPRWNKHAVLRLPRSPYLRSHARNVYSGALWKRLRCPRKTLHERTIISWQPIPGAGGRRIQEIGLSLKRVLTRPASVSSRLPGSRGEIRDGGPVIVRLPSKVRSWVCSGRYIPGATPTKGMHLLARRGASINKFRTKFYCCSSFLVNTRNPRRTICPGKGERRAFNEAIKIDESIICLRKSPGAVPVIALEGF